MQVLPLKFFELYHMPFLIQIPGANSTMIATLAHDNLARAQHLAYPLPLPSYSQSPDGLSREGPRV